MQISATYIKSLQNRMDKIGNNIANINTVGFQEQLLAFEESYNPQERSNSLALYGGLPGPSGAAAETGSLYAGKRLNQNMGALQETGNKWDFAVQGEGFFQVRLADGTIGYTRAGNFTPDAAGNLVTGQGYLLDPPIQIPEGMRSVSIDANGLVTGILPTEDDTSYDPEEEAQVVELGQLTLARFPNINGVEQIGDNIYLATDISGEPIVGLPGDEGFGTIKSGYLEKSNTDLVAAMSDMVSCQRAYQLKSRVIRSQDEMLNTAVTMRG